MTVTDLTTQKGNKDRLNVFVDGEFAFGIDYVTAVKFSIKKGTDIDSETISAILETEEANSAFNRALKYTVKKTVSEKQVREYLFRNGYAHNAIDKAVDKLYEYGYINDSAFAKAYVSTYSSGRGKHRLSAEMKKAGVDEDIICQALEKVDDSEACDRAVEKYLRTHSADIVKLTRYLIYRGFDYEEINEALRRKNLCE